MGHLQWLGGGRGPLAVCLDHSTGHQDEWKSDLGTLPAMQPGSHPLDSSFWVQSGGGAQLMPMLIKALASHMSGALVTI